MVDGRTEEDDEDTFGSFSSAPTIFIKNNNNKYHKDEDDDWGDFVESPLRSNLPKNNNNNNKKGPLPLSLFGQLDDDDDEKPRSVENGFGFSLTNNGYRSDLKGKDLGFDVFGEKYGNVSGLSSDSDLIDKRRDFLSLGKGDLSGLSLNSDIIDKSGDFSSLGKGDLSGLSLNSGLMSDIGDFSSLLKDNLSGFGSDSDLFSKSRDYSSPGKGNLSGLRSDSDLVAKSGDLSSLGLSSNFDMFSINNGLRFSSDLFDVKNSDHSTQVKDTNGDSIVGLHSNLNGLVPNMTPPSGNEEFDADDDAWEFKDAYSESNVDIGVSSKLQENSKVTGISTQAVNGLHESINFSSSAPDGVLFKSIETGLSAVAQKGFSLHMLETVTQNDLSSDSFFSSKKNGYDGGQNSDQSESSEWGSNFHGAFTENGLKEEDIPTTGNASQSEVEVLASNDKIQVNGLRANNHNEALPLALFGEEEELESDDHLNAQEDFSYKPSFTQGKGINNEGINYSIHEVISTLYSQPQQNSSVDYPEKHIDNGLNLKPSVEVLSHIPEDFDEDLDDGSWEFKDASTITHALELSSHLVFYRKLEEQLTLLCRCHIDHLKKAQDTAASSGDDLEVARIDEEIREASKGLQEETLNFQDHLDNQTLTESCLNEFLEVLNEPKFQVLESQHGLSKKLHLAQKDLASAIVAVKHTKLKINILTIGSSDDQYNYVSTWSKIISVCAQELRHGSGIWKQSIGNNLQSLMVSDPRGKDFVISLTEIYRVVIILRASTKLFEPWILSTNSTGIFSLLEDCYTLWSSLSIVEALDLLANNEYQSTVKELLESIKRVHELDELALQDLVLHQQLSTCRLSLLSSKVIPEMSMVMWNGETFFVTLANLWVNLISCDLPDLPHLRVGS